VHSIILFAEGSSGNAFSETIRTVTVSWRNIGTTGLLKKYQITGAVEMV
jgi:hypothetical protein